MSFSLKRRESVAEGIRRVAREQMERALADLRSLRPNRDEAIHNARKRFKKLRGLLRLAARPLGRTFQRENAFFRDLSQGLSEARDAWAMVEAFDKLATRFQRRLPRHRFTAARQRLVVRSGEAPGATARQIQSAIHALEGARRRAERWQIGDGGVSVALEGARQTYRRARRAMQAAILDPRTETFHEWRKAAKYHWHHACLLQSVWPEAMRGRRRALRELSDLLGDDHDLSVLAELIRARPAEYGTLGEARALLALIERRQKELRKAARAMGGRWLGETPEEFAREPAARWRDGGAAGPAS
jgi:CHAD domain-containing protein